MAVSLPSKSNRQRKVTDNIKYFTKPFRVDNYKSHLKTHSVKWEQYKELSQEEKMVFFNKEPQKFVNSLYAYYDTEREDVLR